MFISLLDDFDFFVKFTFLFTLFLKLPATNGSILPAMSDDERENEWDEPLASVQKQISTTTDDSSSTTDTDITKRLDLLETLMSTNIWTKRLHTLETSVTRVEWEQQQIIAVQQDIHWPRRKSCGDGESITTKWLQENKRLKDTLALLQKMYSLMDQKTRTKDTQARERWGEGERDTYTPPQGNNTPCIVHPLDHPKLVSFVQFKMSRNSKMHERLYEISELYRCTLIRKRC